jgi:hypothetical protein
MWYSLAGDGHSAAVHELNERAPAPQPDGSRRHTPHLRSKPSCVDWSVRESHTSWTRGVRLRGKLGTADSTLPT